MDNKEWFSTKEAAGYLSMSLSRMYNLTSIGRIPYYKFGGNNRYKKSELDLVLKLKPKGDRSEFEKNKRWKEVDCEEKL